MAFRQLYLVQKDKKDEPEPNVDAMYASYLMQCRQELQNDPTVLNLLHVFWDIAAKDVNGLIAKSDYLDLMQCIAYAIIDNVSSKEAREIVERDWEYDSCCQENIHYTTFIAALFEICDVWSPFVDAKEYVHFLTELQQSILAPNTLDLSSIPVDEQPMLDGCLPRVLVPISDVQKWVVKSLPPTNEDAYRNGLWLTGIHVAKELKSLSFKALLLSAHTKVFATFSCKLLATPKAMGDAAFVDYQRKCKMNASSLKALRPVERSNESSRHHIHYLTNHQREDIWDPELASIIQLLKRRPGVCIVGAPNSGKTRLATSLAKELGLVYISIPSVLDHILTLPPPTAEELFDSENLQLKAKVRKMLKAGMSISREYALDLLIDFVLHNVHECQGYILDGVYPHEVIPLRDANMGVTHMVCLRGNMSNFDYHVKGLYLEPQTRLIVSERDRSMAKGNQKGYADVYELPNTTSTEVAPVVDLVNAEDENEEDKEVADANDSENTSPVDQRLQYRIPEYGLNELRKYDMTMESEKLISLSSFYAKAVSKGVQEDESSVSATLQLVRTQLTVIDIMFHQSPAAVLIQAVHAIAGALPLLSRLPPSLAPVHVEIPQEILSQPRGEQMRWLLYGDFSPFVQPLGSHPQRLLPLAEARKLSLFCNHCPVALSMGEYTVGSPEFHAILAGRVYLMASKQSLDQFMKRPLAYIRPLVQNGAVKRPSKALPKRIWLIKQSTSWDAQDAIAALAGRLQIDVLDPLSVLRDPQLDSLHTVVLRQGLIMSEAMVTQLVLDETMARSNGFLVHDLPLNQATVDAIEKNSIALDMVLVLDSDASQAAKVVEIIDSLGISFPVVSVPIEPNTQPTEMVATILRALDPLDVNRIDGAEEGVVDAPPLSPIEEESRNTFGATGIYCPVTFANTNLMHRVIPGKAEFTSTFGQKTYRFAGLAEKIAFERNPISYIPTQPTTLFRPVIFLLGITSSGRQTLAENLASTLVDENVTTLKLEEVHRDFEQLVILEKYKMSLEELDESVQTSLYCSALAKAFDRQEKNSSNLFLITGLSTAPSRLPSIELLQQCIERKWFPFLVLPLRIDEDTAVKRRMLNWKYTPPASEPDEADGEPEEASAKRQRLQAEEATARDEEVQRITAQVAGELEAYGSLLQFFNEQHIQVVPEVNATCGPQRVLKEALKTLDSLCLTRRHQLFCTIEQRPIERLNQLVQAGYISIGKHGPYCPVDTTRISVPELPEAVVYRNRLYSVNAKLVASFARTPSAFVALPTKPNRSFVSIAIVGPPQSGKTKLAKALAAMYQLKYLSIDEVLQWIVHCQRGTDLYKFVHEYISCTEPLTFERSLVPDAILLQCIVTRIRAYDVQINGYVLDGFPENSSQAVLWEGMQKSEVSMPMSILCLEASVTDIVGRAKLESTVQFLKRMSQWHLHRLRLYLLWIQTYGCGYLKLLDTHQKSEWKVIAEAAALLEPIVVATDMYFQRLASGLAASMSQLRFSQGYIETHANIRLGSVCPVLFSTANEQKTSLTFDRRYLAEYEHVNYWLADASAYRLFLENPSKFLEARTLLLSGKTAVDMAIGSNLTTGAALRLGFQGYCPVTYFDGNGPNDWNAIRKGSKFIIAAYDNTVFAFTSIGAKLRFIRAPQKFASLELPVKLPPLIDESHRQLNVTLPGRLEQALSKVTEEALLALGQERCKYPGISIQASAIQFVALFLKSKKKASNQSSQLPRDVAAMLQNYINDCHLGSDIKELSVPVGSAVKGVRTVRGKEVTDLSTKATRFDMIVNTPRAFFNAYTMQGLEK